MALPAVVVVIDDRALAYASAHRWPNTVVGYLYAWFVVQIGLLSYTAGRWLPNWWWRLLIIGWSLLLINLTLGRIATDTWGAPDRLTIAVFASEVGALTTWLLLGAAPVWSRFAVFLAALPALGLIGRLPPGWGGAVNDPWSIIVMAQVAGVTAAAALLRVAGYRIEVSRGDDGTSSGAPVQFSIRHLLISTAVIAAVIPVIQRLLRSSWLDGLQWLHASTDGLLLSLVSLTAFWMALGKGRWATKAAIFLVMVLTAGAALWWLETSIAYKVRWSRYPQLLTDAGRWWFAWTLLTGSFLAGSLLVLRATGHRLVRRRRNVYAE